MEKDKLEFMKILKVTKQSLAEAVSIMKNGGAVIYPTETAYALGCDAMSKRAMKKIFQIKKRPKSKGLPVICATKKQVEKFFIMPGMAWMIWKKHWPRPVSVVLETRDRGQGARQVPVRISSNKIARELARKLERPIVSTSANISGAGAIYDSKKIIESFARRKYRPDLVLDAGRLPERKPSTIVKISESGKIEILRHGEISPHLAKYP